MASERSLVQHLKDHSQLCIGDAARLARVACSGGGEVLVGAPRELAERAERAEATADVLHLLPPVLSDLEDSLESALQSARLLHALHAGICAAAPKGEPA
jgi:alkanesulfonate monooxygenase SsuD/methylene tetrahydromethanopterin reductase-like flavin-dependent oxidoreductase (luciferase family)